MVYVYLNLNVTNSEIFAQYRELASPALQMHGCSVVTVGKENITIYGNSEAPDVAVILSFPQKSDVHNWMSDPELASVHELRRKSGILSLILIG